MVHLFGVPIDSEVIRNINPAQMIWYALMFNKEREEEFDAKLNMTEYLASFINAEAVKQTRDSRANKKVVSDEDFEAGLRQRFGRDLSPESLKTATRVDVENEQPVKVEQKKKGSISLEDIKKHMGLDDIKFYPNKK